MSRAKKIWLITAASLLLLGGVIFVSVMAALNWDFLKLSTDKFETNSYEINEKFISISIKTDTADIKIVPSATEKVLVECYELKNAKHAVSVKEGWLYVEVVDTRKWYEHIGINTGSPKITVYIPEGKYNWLSIKSDTGAVEVPKDFRFNNIEITESTGDVTCFASVSRTLKIKTATGGIRVEDMSARTLNLSVSTGAVTVSNVACEEHATINVSTGRSNITNMTCESFESLGSTGDISLKNVVATGSLSIKRDTGDVKFDGCDAAEISVVTDTGDIKGSLLSDKTFIAKSDTGRVNVPKSGAGGRCEITSDTGDIFISVVGN